MRTREKKMNMNLHAHTHRITNDLKQHLLLKAPFFVMYVSMWKKIINFFLHTLCFIFLSLIHNNLLCIFAIYNLKV